MSRGPGAVAVVIDSQSVKGADTVPVTSRGWDQAKKVNGRKRHLACETKGLPVAIRVTAADVTDRAAARELLWRLRILHPELTIAWADSAYSGALVEWAAQFLDLTVNVVTPPRITTGVHQPREAAFHGRATRATQARRHRRSVLAA